jgi:hypothetical protein
VSLHFASLDVVSSETLRPLNVSHASWQVVKEVMVCVITHVGGGVAASRIRRHSCYTFMMRLTYFELDFGMPTVLSKQCSKDAMS